VHTNPSLWQSIDAWRRNFPRLKAFHSKHGHVDPGGPLGIWLKRELREARKPDYSPKRHKMLEDLGVKFEPDFNYRLWSLRMTQLQSYIEANGTWKVGPEDRDLQLWLWAARRDSRDGIVPKSLVHDLEALGVPIEPLKRGPLFAADRPIFLSVPPGEAFGSDGEEPVQESPR